MTKTDALTHGQTLDQAQGILLKRVRKDSRSRRLKNNTRKPTESTNLISQELTEFGSTAREPG